jgi:Holliday junction resolvase RusA-like endonuclease
VVWVEGGRTDRGEKALTITFTVHGTPQPQGSTKAFIPKGWKRAVLTSDNKRLRPWRQDLSFIAQEAMTKAGAELTEGPVEVAVTFYFARPKSLKKAVTEKTTKPDLDKLLRGLLDSLTGIVYRDDAQVVRSAQRKEFGLPERAEVLVEIGGTK